MATKAGALRTTGGRVLRVADGTTAGGAPVTGLWKIVGRAFEHAAARRALGDTRHAAELGRSTGARC